MSERASISAAPLPFSEYDSGAAYPMITTLPPLSSANNGSMSNKAQALRDRLNKAENDFDAGEDAPDVGFHSGSHPSLKAPQRNVVQHQVPKPPAEAPVRALPQPVMVPQSHAGPSAVYNNAMHSTHAYASPNWHHDIRHPQPNSNITSTNSQIDHLIQMLEAREQKRQMPDTTTEDLVSLAFVGMFFMLAVHALSPPVAYRR